jgi:branched-subunit amino acid ABC-type transport system permease component
VESSPSTRCATRSSFRSSGSLVTAQHLFGAVQTWGIYSLVAITFYLASVSCRHFNFAAVLPFIGVSLLASTYTSTLGTWGGIGMGLAGAYGLGFLYHRASAALARAGAGEGQLLIISLAVLAIGENTLLLASGGGSRTLWSVTADDRLSLGPVTTTMAQAVALCVGVMVVLMHLVAWQRTGIGRAVRGLDESPLNMSLAGYNVPRLEGNLAAWAFLLAGGAGALWATAARVRPSMSLEVAAIGIATCIVAPLFARGVLGLLLASAALAVLKLLLALWLPGDWTTTSVILLLVVSVLVHRMAGHRLSRAFISLVEGRAKRSPALQ